MMLRTLNSAAANASESRRQSSANFKNSSPPTEPSSRVLQCKGFCALIKDPPAGDTEPQRYRSSDGEGFLGVYVPEDKNAQRDSPEGNDVRFKQEFEDIPVESPENIALPELCSDFHEMSKVNFHASTVPSLQNQVALPRDSKPSQDMLNLVAGAENIFDENFDLEDFMNSQSSCGGANSSHHLSTDISFNLNLNVDDSPSHLEPDMYAAASQTTHGQGSELANSLHYMEAVRSSSASFSNGYSSGEHSQNSMFSHVHNNAFIHSLDESRKASSSSSHGEMFFVGGKHHYLNIPNSDQPAFPAPNFPLYGRLENDGASATPHTNNNDGRYFCNEFTPNMLSPAPGHKFNETNGHFMEVSSHSGAVCNWQSSTDASDACVTNGSNESEDFGPSSRTESRETDDCDAVEVGSDQVAPTRPSLQPTTSESRNSSKKTAYNEKWGVKVFKAWCLDNKMPDEFEKINAEELNNLLTKFWQSIRKSNGDYYGRNSLFNLRAMINKHLKGEPYCASFDIVTDDRFRLSNECLDEQLKHLKGLGRTIAHKVPISPEDIQKLYESKVFSTTSPVSLLRKVWFEITLHFCPKGGESQEKIRKTTFEIHHDKTGRRYVARATLTRQEEGKTEARMYDTYGAVCPVKSYEFYLSKLHPMQQRLFQQPRKKTNANSLTWYGKSPIGEKALQQMMANISIEANLSKRYTNHCVRTTALQQFTDLRKQYEALDTPVSHQMLEKGNSCIVDGSARHQPIERLEGMTLTSNGFSRVHMNGSEGSPLPMNFYPTSTFETPTVSKCGSRYDTGNGQMRRQPDSMSAHRGFASFCDNKPDDGCLAKKGYNESSKSFPPPPYSEHRFMKLNSVPLKRIRTEGPPNFIYQQQHHPESESLPPVSKPPNPFSIHDRNCATQYSGPPPPYMQFSHPQSNGYQENPLPVMSPIPIATTTPPTTNINNSKNRRIRKKAIKGENKLSETIVNGYPFELIETDSEYQETCAGS